MRRLRRPVASLIIAAALVGVGWWAGSVTVQPPEDPLVTRQPVTYTVADGTVERSLRLIAHAGWQYEDLARNARSGIVTSVDVEAGTEVSPGDIIYTVDLRPVVVAEGRVPAFRDLLLGMRGQDVAQLQRLLQVLGRYNGKATGTFTTAVTSAVRAWQKSLGLAPDGVVRLGDVVFIPDLPARIALSDDVEVGASLQGGERAIRRALGVDFWIALSPEQRAAIPLSATVTVSHGNGTWQARISNLTEDAGSGEVRLNLVAPDGGPVCMDDCDQAVPRADGVSFPATVVVVPAATGPIVPVAAIQSLPDGFTVVTRPDGSTTPVRIIAASDGMAVVTGVRAGEVVVLPVGTQTP